MLLPRGYLSFLFFCAEAYLKEMSSKTFPPITASAVAVLSVAPCEVLYNLQVIGMGGA